MKVAVITGADGFLGSHLIKHLIVNDFEIYAIIVKNSNIRYRLEGLRNTHIIEADLNEHDEIISLLPKEPDVFFHLAWAGVTPDQRKDFAFQMQNVNLSLNAVKLAASLGSKKFIFPGSTMEYIYYGKPIDHDAVPSPQNAYGVAKIAARYTCSVLCKELGLPFIYVVISGIYSEDRKDNNVVFYTIEKLLHKEKPMLTKLEQLWDYVHIDDVVYGLRLVAEKGKNDSFYVIGHGDNWPLANYIYMIRDAIDANLPLGVGEIPYPNNMLPCSCVSLDSIQKDTGYTPKISFDQGIKRVIYEVKKRDFGEE